VIFYTVARAIRRPTRHQGKDDSFHRLANLQDNGLLFVMNDGTSCHGAKGRIVRVARFYKMIALTGEQIAGLLVRVTANRVDASVGTLAIEESLGHAYRLHRAVS